MMTRTQMTDAEYGRFMIRVNKLDSGCWEWTGYREKAGYGEFNFAGKRMRTHRISFRHFRGEIPLDKPHLDHTCENKSCVNPDHLDPVTPGENTRRYVMRKYKGMCGRGHPREMGKECGHCNSLRTGKTWLRKWENVCRKGHPFTPENTYIVGPFKNRLCKTCAAAKGRRQWETKRRLRTQIVLSLTALKLNLPFLVLLSIPELSRDQSG